MFGLFKKSITGSDVVRRLLVLRALVSYAHIMPPRYVFESAYPQWSATDKKDFQAQLNQTSQEYCQKLKASGLWDAVTPQERAFFQSTSLSWEPQQHREASWRVEAAVPLLWALTYVHEFPAFDQQTNTSVFNLIPSSSLESLLKECRLRPSKEIEEKRSLAELWHWRSRTRQLIEDGETLPKAIIEKTGLKTYDDIVRQTAQFARKRGDLPKTLDGDFLAKGKAYRELTDEEWAEVRSITVERHFSLNWLGGLAPKNAWDKTPTDT